MGALQSNYLNKFSCLADKCPDTCCYGWSMNTGKGVLEKYASHPDLTNITEEKDDVTCMKKAANGFCIKYEDGLCSIHKKYGADMLGDACYFFPKIMRDYDKNHIITAAISCPEIARLILSSNDIKDFALTSIDENRTPELLKDYLQENITLSAAISINWSLLEFVESSNDAEIAIISLLTLAKSMDNLPKESWAEAAPFYLSNLENLITTPELDEMNSYKMLHILLLMAKAVTVDINAKFLANLKKHIEILKAEINPDNCGVSLPYGNQYQQIKSEWDDNHYQKMLKNYLKFQLSTNLIPFGGAGDNISQKITLIAIKFSLLKSILMSFHYKNGKLPDEEIVDICYSFSRFIDHLSNPIAMIELMDELGITGEARINGVIY